MAVPFPCVGAVSEDVREALPVPCAVAGPTDLCLSWLVGLEAVVVAVVGGLPVPENILALAPVPENVLAYHLYLEIVAPLDLARLVPDRRIDLLAYRRAEISDPIVVAQYSVEAQKPILAHSAAKWHCSLDAFAACHCEKDAVAVAPRFDCS